MCFHGVQHWCCVGEQFKVVNEGAVVQGEPIGIIVIAGRERERPDDGFCIARRGGIEK